MVLKLEYQSGELSCGFISKGIRRQFDRVLRELTFLSLSGSVQNPSSKDHKSTTKYAAPTHSLLLYISPLSVLTSSSTP